MNTIDHLRELYAYNGWANARTLAKIRECDCPRALQLFCHLLITEQEYFDRLSDKDSSGFDFWPDLDVAECETAHRSNGTHYSELLSTISEAQLDRTASYRNSRGEHFQNTWRELLTHVLLHSATHRGNIILKLRESGFEPPVIDHIIYLRER